MLSNLMAAVSNHLFLLYCFTSCPPSAGHINQTAMGGILIRVLINLTATFTDQPFALSWRWTSPQFHLSSLLHLANHRDEAQSLADSDIWGCLCDVCLVYILLLIPMLILCLSFVNAHIALCWFEHVLYHYACSYALGLCWYAPILLFYYVLVYYANVLIS